MMTMISRLGRIRIRCTPFFPPLASSPSLHFSSLSSSEESDPERSQRHPDFLLAESFEQSKPHPLYTPVSFVKSLLPFGDNNTSAEENTISQELKSIAGSYRVLHELQHPLLAKYHFDGVGFIKGSMMAHARVLDCLYSNDFRTSSGSVKIGDTYSYLKDVCCEEAFDSFVDHVRQGYGGDDMFKVLSEKQTDDFTLDKIDVVLIPQDADHVKKPDILVIADVSFLSNVELEYNLQSEPKQRSISPRVSKWQLMGCLSSHSNSFEDEEVNWKISKVISHGSPFYE